MCTSFEEGRKIAGTHVWGNACKHAYGLLAHTARVGVRWPKPAMILSPSGRPANRSKDTPTHMMMYRRIESHAKAMIQRRFPMNDPCPRCYLGWVQK